MATELPLFKTPQSFPINWAGSKEHIAKYVIECGAHEVVGGMIYDLGHHGRGFSDFGLNDKLVTLKFTQGKFLRSGRELETYSSPIDHF